MSERMLLWEIPVYLSGVVADSSSLGHDAVYLGGGVGGVVVGGAADC
jgi:hypothetical protein